MGLLNFVLSTVGRGVDAACLLLDLNFVVVHTVIQTFLAVIAFINNLPSVLLSWILQLGNFALFCLVSLSEATSDLAQGTMTTVGSLMLALEGLLESLKMVGYLSLHYIGWAKDHLSRGLVQVLEGCSIAFSLVLYFTNTVINYVLIATQNVYQAMPSMLQMLTGLLNKVLELGQTWLTFFYSTLVGMSVLLWSTCKLALDFAVSLVHIFISIFILNVYGLVLTVTITLTTTAYLNPALTRQAALRIVDYFKSSRVLRLFYVIPAHLTPPLRRSLHIAHGSVERLKRAFLRLYTLERQLWQCLSHLSTRWSLALRTRLQRQNRRVQGDGENSQERRDLPDGRPGESIPEANAVLPSSSTDKPLEKQPDVGRKPTDKLLSLLKEQEDTTKCVICQDSTKTVVLMPCRHLCLCSECTTILMTQPLYLQNCPLCRCAIFRTIDVYL